MRFVLVALAALLCSSACIDKEAAAKKKADAQKAFMEAESKARSEQEASEAKKAIADATAGCAGGTPEQCIALGRIHVKATATPSAIEAFAKACKLKSKEGCRLAADSESDGKGKLAYIKSLCSLEDADACLQGAALADELVKAGQLREAPNPSARDSIVLLKRACDLGAAIACTAGGMALADLEPKDSVKLFTKGCDRNEPTACLQLAGMMSEGKGMKKKDPAKAKILRKKACDAGLKDAC